MKRSLLGVITLCVAAGAWSAIFYRARWGDHEIGLVGQSLTWLAPLAFAVSVLVTAIGLLLCRREFTDVLRSFHGRHWLCLSSVLLLILIFRLVAIPATERVYYDEHTYVQAARALAQQGRAAAAVYGVVRNGRYEEVVGSYTHWPAGWPSVLAGAMWLSGDTRHVGPKVNLVLSLTAAALLALLSASLFRDPVAAIMAAACYTCVPANQIWSRSGASEVFGAFAATLAVFAAVRFAATPGFRAGILAAASAAVAAQARNELTALLPVLAVTTMVLARRRGLRGIVYPAALVAILLLVQAIHLGTVSRAYEPQDVQGAGFGWNYLPRNLSSVGEYLWAEPVAAVCLLLAVVGLVLKETRKAAAPLALWAVVVFAIPMFHFGGSYAFPGGERFVLAWLPPVAIFAGATLARVHLVCRRRVASPVLVGLWAILFIAAGLAACPHVIAMDRQTDDVRGDCEFLRRALRQVPADAVVITSDSPVVLAEGRTTAFLPWCYWEPNRLYWLEREHPGGIYYYVSPSSNPNRWPNGDELEMFLFETFHDRCVVKASSPAGLRALYRLSTRPPKVDHTIQNGPS